MDINTVLLIVFVCALGWFLYNSYDKTTHKFNFNHGLAAIVSLGALVITWVTHWGAVTPTGH